MKTLTGHSDAVRALAVADNRLFSGSYDGTVKVWDTDELTCLQTLSGHTGPVRTLVYSGEAWLGLAGAALGWKSVGAKVPLGGQWTWFPARGAVVAWTSRSFTWGAACRLPAAKALTQKPLPEALPCPVRAPATVHCSTEGHESCPGRRCKPHHHSRAQWLLFGRHLRPDHCPNPCSLLAGHLNLSVRACAQDSCFLPCRLRT